MILVGSSGIRRVCSGLAITSTALCVGGCFADPPEYEGQVRLPPFVIMASVMPNPGLVSTVEDGMMQIEVPFRSEDLDETVSAVFAVDSEFVTDLEYGPSVFANQTRKVEETIQLDEGCHLVQLTLTHTDNLRRPSNPPIEPRLAAFVYWWAIVPPEEGEVHCPR